MKKLILLITTCISLSISAQQLPLFSQYYNNPFIYNPSLSGIDAGTSVSLTARKQFTGLANNIGTYAATLQSRAGGRKAGFGLYVYNDDANLLRTNALNGSYAYHINLDKEKTLSFGLGVSVLDHRYNSNRFYLVQENDPLIAFLNSEGGVSVDANIGANLDLGDFSFGLGNLQLLQNQEAFKNNANQKIYYTLRNHWVLNAAYNIEVNDDFEIEPYLLYRKTITAPGQIDLNVFFKWLEKGYLGLAYRDGISFSTMVGVNLNPNITAGYAFDYTTHQLKTALGNTHEVMLKFNLGNSEQAKPKEHTKSAAETDKKLKSLESKIAELEKEVEDTKEAQKKVEAKKETTTKEVEKEKEYVPKTETPKQPTTIDKKFYVIAGSFANSVAAQGHIKKLRAQGYRGYEKYDSTSGRTYVHLGDFTNKDYARDWITKLKGSGLPLWIKSM